MKTAGKKRSFKLLQSWKLQVASTILPFASLKVFGSKCLLQAERTRSVVNLEINFDYNTRTFVPTQKPFISEADCWKEDVDHAYTRGMIHKQPGTVIFVVLLTFQQMVSLMPMMIEVNGAPPGETSWDDILVLFKDVTLSSSLFQTFPALQQENFKAQIQNGIRLHSGFQRFLLAALEVESRESLHKTCVVVVHAELGFGLGELKQLKSFEVMPVERLLRDMQQQSDLSPQQIDYFTRECLDLENAPGLVQSRRMYPKNALLPVVFVARPIFFVLPNLVEIHDNRAIRPARKLKEIAKKSFTELQQAAIPKVSSPEIE